MDLEIRKATREDIPAIAELLRSLELFPHFLTQPPEAVLKQVARQLTRCQADDSHSVYVAQTGAGPIHGYCAVHWLPYLMMPGPEGYISELFLRPSSRGLGLGGQLLKAVTAEAEARGCSRLMLLNLKIRESYQRGFYKKQGWRERPEVANFILNLQNGS